MNENMNTDLNREETDFLADYLKRHPETIISLEKLREAGPEIAEFKDMVAKFEVRHNLLELHAIVDLSPELATVFEFARDLSCTPEQLNSSLELTAQEESQYVEIQRKKITAARNIVLTPEDAKIYKMRIDAREDIKEIFLKLDIIKKETNIFSDKYEELRAEYKRLSRAVGTVNKNKVIHNI